MLISLLAMFLVALSTGTRAALAEAPNVLENPSTLKLGLIGAGILFFYAVLTRAIGRGKPRIASADVSSQMAIAAGQTTAVTQESEQEPSRGAA